MKREGEIGGDRKRESGLIEERKRERRELRRDKRRRELRQEERAYVVIGWVDGRDSSGGRLQFVCWWV